MHEGRKERNYSGRTIDAAVTQESIKSSYFRGFVIQLQIHNRQVSVRRGPNMTALFKYLQ